MHYAKNSEFRFSRLRIFSVISFDVNPVLTKVLALNYEIQLLKLNSSKRIKVYCFLFKSNDLLHRFSSVEFTEVTMAIH